MPQYKQKLPHFDFTLLYGWLCKCILWSSSQLTVMERIAEHKAAVEKASIVIEESDNNVYKKLQDCERTISSW